MPRTQAGRAVARLYAQRRAFIKLYDPSRPYMPTALFFTCLLLAIMVVLVGNLLRRLYELDGPISSSSSGSRSGSNRGPSSSDPAQATPWVMAEIKKRQSEQAAGKTPDQTLERFKKESEAERQIMKAKLEKLPPEKGKEYRSRKEKERAGELKVLKGQLRKYGLTTVGTEGEDKVNKAKDVEVGSEGGGPAGAGDKTEAAQVGDGEVPSSQGVGDGAKWQIWRKIPKFTLSPSPSQPSESKPLGERLKRAVLPIPSKNAIPRPAGSGWEMSNDPRALAGLASSAGNAESLAARMKA